MAEVERAEAGQGVKHEPAVVTVGAIEAAVDGVAGEQRQPVPGPAGDEQLPAGQRQQGADAAAERGDELAAIAEAGVEPAVAVEAHERRVAAALRSSGSLPTAQDYVAAEHDRPAAQLHGVDCPFFAIAREAGLRKSLAAELEVRPTVELEAGNGERAADRDDPVPGAARARACRSGSRFLWLRAPPGQR